MTLPVLAEHLQQRGGSGDLVGKELLWHVKESIKGAPRSHQRMIGPSEIGDPCARRIAYKLLGTAELAERPPAWPATVGTGVHLWLADAFTPHEVETGQERWFVETKLVVGQVDGEDVTGTCDLYDRDTATVIDWKTTSKAKIGKLRHGTAIDERYLVQINLYARGWKLLGHPVDQVMIVYLPRDGQLADAYVWHDEYREDVALNALERLHGISTIVTTFGVDALDLIPTTESYCLHCSYLRTGSSHLGEGCPGDPAMLTPTAAITVRGA